MSKQISFSRRTFLKFSGFAAAGFVMGISSDLDAKTTTARSNFNPNLFLNITAVGAFEIVCHRSEMGQGTRTAIVSLIAEELEVALDQVTIVQATGDKKFGDQNTDGSRSIRYNWKRLREFGATAKQMFVTAASKLYSCKESDLTCDRGIVYYAKKSKKIAYTELLNQVNDLEAPKSVQIKDPKDFKIIGKSQLLKDVPDMVTGKAIFGMDVEVEGMLYAAMTRCPNPHGVLERLDGTKALKVKGVHAVFPVAAIKQPTNTDASVCVVGNSTYICFKALKELDIEWSYEKHDKVSTKSFRGDLEKALKNPSKVYVDKKSKTKHDVKSSLTRKYFTPFQVHAPMEPLVAVADVKGDSCEVWAPTQDPQRLRKTIAAVLKIDLEKVTVNVTFLGGGFGRKSQPDFGVEAVLASKKVKKPVKLVWQREDEIRHGFYHTSSLQEISADLDDQGLPVSWDHTSVFPTIMSVFMPGAKTAAEWEIGMGASNLPYNIPNVKVSTGEVENPLKIGWKRAVCNIFHSYAVNTFMDELAQNAKMNPFDYRLNLLDETQEIAGYHNSRAIKVIKRLREFSDYDNRIKKKKHVGVAYHGSFSSYVASTVEVEGDNLGNLQVKDIHIVIDLGHYVNPDTVKSQMEGSAIFALSLSLYGKIDLDKGAVVQSNFHDFQLVRHHESPRVHVDIINNHEEPGGAGEPGVPAVVPALINAIYLATNKRYTELPLKA